MLYALLTDKQRRILDKITFGAWIYGCAITVFLALYKIFTLFA